MTRDSEPHGAVAPAADRRTRGADPRPAGPGAARRPGPPATGIGPAYIARPERVRSDPFSPESEARLCERVLGGRRHGL
ncbi:hypothetical protein [Nocardiopsis trehalosi]|uniref:hypothetical protein n=1 Tax=Nocardiopsis trehalosi TaxID=109329 RepID=UPI0008306351|nr:hypothetical protein [Nocardiopsis trehalosi]